VKFKSGDYTGQGRCWSSPSCSSNHDSTVLAVWMGGLSSCKTASLFGNNIWIMGCTWLPNLSMYSLAIIRYLHTEHKQKINAEKHPCLEEDSNIGTSVWAIEDSSCLRPRGHSYWLPPPPQPADHSGHTVYGMKYLRSFELWDRGFEA
jgi:hypothetical protein